MSLEFLSQGYNRVNRKWFSFTFKKGLRKTKYVVARNSEEIKVTLEQRC